MIANHIHDALTQVRTLQSLILEKRLFQGYSGRARIASGTLALLCAVILSSNRIPATAQAQLLGWGTVLGLALLLNYGALAFSFVFDPAFQRNPLMMKPAIDAVPPLAMGGVLSLSLILLGQHNPLFGTWMTLYGLAHTACRHSMPRANYFVGLFYLVSGTICLLSPVVSFLNPWPMGIVFFTGEFVGGLILIANRSVLTHGKPLVE